ncbi:MAG TPA: AMP-binding protein, partial [Blastocatellia bacterium]|nr:AMP-binding protein [Blastocatellia bacterium]
SHGLLLRCLAGFEMINDLDLGDDTLLWTPAEWGPLTLLNFVYPALYYGRPMVADSGDYADRRQLVTALVKYGITNALLPGQAFRLLVEHEYEPETHRMKLRTAFTVAEPIDAHTADCLNALGVSVNSGYLGPDGNIVAASCARWFSPRPGSVGRTVPGNVIQIVDEAGRTLPPGREGRIVVGRADESADTHEPGNGDCRLTEDYGVIDSEGYLRIRR